MVSILIEFLKELSDKVTHIKGRLLDQAVILFNCIPFQNGNFSESKEFAPGAILSLKEQFLMVWKITFTTLGDLP